MKTEIIIKITEQLMSEMEKLRYANDQVVECETLNLVDHVPAERMKANIQGKWDDLNKMLEVVIKAERAYRPQVTGPMGRKNTQAEKLTDQEKLLVEDAYRRYYSD